MDFYAFVEGPLVWISILTCLIGCLLRAAMFVSTASKKDKILGQHFSLKYILLTILRWILPVHPDMQKNPVFSILAYVFHVCLVLLPVFVYQHVVMWEVSSLEWSWATLPAGLSDWMTLLFLAAAVFLLLRRIFTADVRFLSTFADYALLVVTALPFLTGYLSVHGTLPAGTFLGDNMQLIHMLSGELMLILIPFTKLSHFVLFFFSRAATGIEFGRRGYSV